METSVRVHPTLVKSGTRVALFYSRGCSSCSQVSQLTDPQESTWCKNKAINHFCLHPIYWLISYVVNFPANHLLGYICKLYSYEQFLHRFSAVSFDKDSFGNGLWIKKALPLAKYICTFHDTPYSLNIGRRWILVFFGISCRNIERTHWFNRISVLLLFRFEQERGRHPLPKEH